MSVDSRVVSGEAKAKETRTRTSICTCGGQSSMVESRVGSDRAHAHVCAFHGAAMLMRRIKTRDAGRINEKKSKKQRKREKKDETEMERTWNSKNHNKL
jgi:hypothetical protein